MSYLSTAKWTDFQEYTVNRIRTAKVDWDPYWHVLIQDTLHPELFEMISNEWPNMYDDAVVTHSNPVGYNQNRKIFHPDHVGVEGFWKEYFYTMISHDAIIDAVYSLEDLNRADCDWCSSSLWEDYAGYSVSNHYDAHTISVAWQLYVYCDGGEKWGTSLNDEQGNQLKRFPFTPNLSWLMRVDANSWHSCDEVDSKVRRSVMGRFMTKQRG